MQNHDIHSQKKASGFTLVEVMLALGVVAFSMVSIMGLLPVGLNLFKQAMTNTVESQIIQTVTNDLLLTDFNNLNANTTLTYQYDNEGRRITSGTSSSGYAPIYTATVTFNPVNDPNSYPVNLQSQGGASNEALQVRIHIVNRTYPNQAHSYSFIIANHNI